MSRELLSKARELSENADHPQALGLIATMEVICAIQTGNWKSASQLAARADDILREKCTGVAWERGTNTGLGMTAALLLGEWGKLVDHRDGLYGLVEEAKARGDVHTIHYLLSPAHIGALVSDRPLPSGALFREIFAYLPRQGFYVPHFMQMMDQINTALYEGDAERAWMAVSSAWPPLSESFLLRSVYFYILACEFRGRAALAMAAASPDNRKYLHQARRCASRIERKRTPWGNALALVIRAGTASIENNRAATLDLLARAETQLEAVHMTQWLAACRYRRGKLLGGLEGQTLVSAAEAWAKAERVVNPPRIFAMLAPGTWGSS